MAFAVSVETIMAHWRPTIRAHWRSNSAKNAIRCEFKVIRESIQDRGEDLMMRKIYQA